MRERDGNNAVGKVNYDAACESDLQIGETDKEKMGR
jgi:hypothetical protein